MAEAFSSLEFEHFYRAKLSDGRVSDGDFAVVAWSDGLSQQSAASLFDHIYCGATDHVASLNYLYRGYSYSSVKDEQGKTHYILAGARIASFIDRANKMVSYHCTVLDESFMLGLEGFWLPLLLNVERRVSHPSFRSYKEDLAKFQIPVEQFVLAPPTDEDWSKYIYFLKTSFAENESLIFTILAALIRKQNVTIINSPLTGEIQAQRNEEEREELQRKDMQWRLRLIQGFLLLLPPAARSEISFSTEVFEAESCKSQFKILYQESFHRAQEGEVLIRFSPRLMLESADVVAVHYVELIREAWMQGIEFVYDCLYQYPWNNNYQRISACDGYRDDFSRSFELLAMKTINDARIANGERGLDLLQAILVNDITLEKEAELAYIEDFFLEAIQRDNKVQSLQILVDTPHLVHHFQNENYLQNAFREAFQGGHGKRALLLMAKWLGNAETIFGKQNMQIWLQFFEEMVLEEYQKLIAQDDTKRFIGFLTLLQHESIFTLFQTSIQADNLLSLLRSKHPLDYDALLHSLCLSVKFQKSSQDKLLFRFAREASSLFYEIAPREKLSAPFLLNLARKLQDISAEAAIHWSVFWSIVLANYPSDPIVKQIPDFIKAYPKFSEFVRREADFSAFVNGFNQNLSIVIEEAEFRKEIYYNIQKKLTIHCLINANWYPFNASLISLAQVCFEQLRETSKLTKRRSSLLAELKLNFLAFFLDAYPHDDSVSIAINVFCREIVEEWIEKLVGQDAKDMKELSQNLAQLTKTMDAILLPQNSIEAVHEHLWTALKIYKLEESTLGALMNHLQDMNETSLKDSIKMVQYLKVIHHFLHGKSLAEFAETYYSSYECLSHVHAIFGSRSQEQNEKLDWPKLEQSIIKSFERMNSRDRDNWKKRINELMFVLTKVAMSRVKDKKQVSFLANNTLEDIRNQEPKRPYSPVFALVWLSGIGIRTGGGNNDTSPLVMPPMPKRSTYHDITQIFPRTAGILEIAKVIAMLSDDLSSLLAVFPSLKDNENMDTSDWLLFDKAIASEYAELTDKRAFYNTCFGLATVLDSILDGYDNVSKVKLGAAPKDTFEFFMHLFSIVQRS